MWSLYNRDYRNSLEQLSETSSAFFERMGQLMSANAQGLERRGLRVGATCGERAFRELFEISESHGLDELRQVHHRSLGDCSDACMEEVRNAEQIALMTHEELVYWRRQFFQQWAELFQASLPRTSPQTV